MKITTPLILITMAFLCAAAAGPNAHAVSPPPDGGYANFTTAEGQNALKNLTSGAGNSGLGWYSLFSDSTASYNTGVGAGTLALNNGDNNTATGVGALLLNTSGFGNTANGVLALVYNDTGSNNTAVGGGALANNTNGNSNTGIGVGALGGNIDGAGNTATGALALNGNNDGSFNTAIGLAALQNNHTGANNTATGAGALAFNDANNNTAMGASALHNNATGFSNSAFGQGALASTVGGNRNTAISAGALSSNTEGELNTAVGFQALNTNTTGSANTAVGKLALLNNSTGNDNIAIGNLAGQNLTTGNSNIDIGADGVAGEERTIRIGHDSVQTRTFIARIHGVPQGGNNILPVYINSDGQLGTQPPPSSRRFKKAIRPMDKTSEAILGLKPVTFQYQGDKTNTPQFGLVAEEVAEADPDLVVRDENGEIYSVRYDAVNAMLLNEFLEERRTVLELKKEVAALTAMMKEQAAQIRKVSAELELSRSAARVAQSR